jgi:diacylglycerol kinase (ATP)
MLGPFRHLIGSTRYSLQGVGVLVREMAARIEIGAFFIVLVILAIVGAELRHWIIVTVMFLILLAVEALNTAIEAIVDRVSPERSDFARDAKDLGSAGVFFTVLATATYLLAAVLGTIGIITF